MAFEIERKFLVNQDLWDTTDKPVGEEIIQIYLHADSSKAIRVRTKGKKAFITIKSSVSDLKRLEFEYEIPYEDAKIMLEMYSNAPTIEKVRHTFEVDGSTWEVDEFHGKNEGLILAEIELESEEQHFVHPIWLGHEVTDDKRYLNSNLAMHPIPNH